MARGTLALAIFALSFAQGCVLGAIDHAAKPCPCAPGYICDDARNRCVREGDDAGGPLDATIDAGSHAGADVDAHVDDPSTACDDLLRDALFCESFEDASLLRWNVQEASSGRVGHSRARAFRGQGTLHAESTAPGGYAERIARMPSAIGSDDLYLRAYVFLEPGAMLPHASLLHVGVHRTDMGTEPLAGFNVNDGYASMYIGAANVRLDEPLVELPRDAWFCVQIHLHVDEVAGSASFWIDGTLAGERHDLDTRGDEPYVRVGAGIGWAPLEQQAFGISIDELAIGTTPLPCE